MSLWAKSDNLASTPKYVARKAYFDSASTSVVSTSANTINLIPSNTGFNTGDNVVYSINGGTVIGGLTDGTVYTVRVVAAGVIELYDTWDHAIDVANTTGRVDITSVGVGTHTLQRNAIDSNVFGDHIYNGSRIVFVDLDEAQQPENRARGLKNVGWWAYRSWTNADGSVQHRAECLVALSSHRDTAAGATGFNTQANTGDNTLDDDILRDSTPTITVQPVSRSVVAPATATFSLSAVMTGVGSLTYQWQVQEGGTGSWTNVSRGTGGQTASYTTAATIVPGASGASTHDNNGDKYRCIVGTSTANTNAISDVVTLTVTA